MHPVTRVSSCNHPVGVGFSFTLSGTSKHSIFFCAYFRDASVISPNKVFLSRNEEV